MKLKFSPLLLTILWLSPLSGWAQQPMVSETYREAEAALLNHNYKKAIRLFNKVLETHPDLAAAYRGLGLSYELSKDYVQSAEYLNKVIELDSVFSRVIYYEAGKANYRAGNYEKALEHFQRFRRMQSVPPEAFGYRGETESEVEKKYLQRLSSDMRACHMAMDSAKFQGITEIVNLGERINTKADEYFACLTNDREIMLYTHRPDLRSDEDLYYSKFENDRWSRGRPLRGFNTDLDEGMSSLVRNNRKMFFTACDREGVYGPCDIWEADIEGVEIKSIKALDGYANSERWEGHATVSCDGSVIYFASSREGGFGGWDLWYSERKEDGSWGDPVNMGPSVNTRMDEQAPFISNDGKTLYFTSNGHPGMGGIDIFVSWLDVNGQWSVPINLGPPVNTAHEEIGFFLSSDGMTGYLASDRPGGEGGFDLYQFQLTEKLYSDPITFVEGRVRDSLLNEPVVTTAQIAGRGGVPTDKEGRFFLCMPAGRELNVLIEEENYRPYRIRIPIPEWDNRQPFVLDIALSPIRAFAVRSVDTVAATPVPTPDKVEREYSCQLFFGFDSDKLEINEVNRLDEFMAGLNDEDITRVEIVGYADEIGADDYNLELSEERAKKIALLMREYGIIVHKIYLEGRGELHNDNPNRENRRVEVRVFTMEEP